MNYCIRTRCNFSFKGPGVLVCSIDNMPTQMPLESTNLFGDLLLPYAMDILQSDATKPLDEENFSPAVLGVSQIVIQADLEMTKK